MRINNSNKVKTFTKWTGGKRQLLPELIELMPINLMDIMNLVGGGAYYLSWHQKKLLLMILIDLILAYREIRDNVEELTALKFTGKTIQGLLFRPESYR